MKRKNKYPDTTTFHYFNANPKNRITGDCRIRAIAVACDVPYNQVVMDLAQIQCDTGYDQTTNQGLNILLKKYGWVKRKQPRKCDNTKYTGKEFCDYLYQYSDRSFIPYIDGNVVATIGGHHMVAFVKEETSEYRCYDIWDSTNGCIGNYWVKEN